MLKLLNMVCTRFFVRINGKVKAFPFDEVLFITAKKNYSEIVTTGKKCLAYVSLTQLEEQLPENLFCRVHRSHIVSVARIDSFDHNIVEIAEHKLPITKVGFKEITQRVLMIGGGLENKSSKK